MVKLLVRVQHPRKVLLSVLAGLCLISLSGLPGGDPHDADYHRIKLIFKST